ncbi:MAG: hypothetical protein O2996_04315 [Actinomycetota bacterium]|nr:hypothetical protein [Actinomycetota bacterium]
MLPVSLINGGTNERGSTASRVCARGTHSGMQKQLEPIDLAKCVESSLHTSLDGFDLPRARLYGVSIVDADGVRSNHNGALRISFLAEHGDVYELLDAPSSAIARMFDAAVVLTCGWAAPIDRDESPANEDSSEVPPSQHPQRRRVRLVVSVCDNGVASVLRFADTPDDIVTDAGSARGSLADAVNNLWRDPKVVISRETID